MKTKDLKLKFFLNEAILFLGIQFFALLCGLKLLIRPEVQVYIKESSFSWFSFLAGFFIATIFIFLILKFSRSIIPPRLLFALLIFIGSFLVLGIYFNNKIALIFSFLIVFLRFIWPYVIVQNISIILAIIGSAVFLGLSIEVWHLIPILVILPFYDVIAVYKTKHMVFMFKRLMRAGAIFALIIPLEAKGYLKNLKELAPGEKFIFLGTGDLAFPIIFAISALKIKFISAILVILGAFLGLCFIHFFFLRQEERKPIPALPPIAIGAISGFLISLVI
ncbi:MAG: hypothetical protein COY82_01035 [Parcubacteria group bacterium CG_4_10_14_0_8_um_filter_35_7]|nr:MAG: hypothetical protein COX43_00205 [Parcubacteria group bacterium CG23_combo_of_CG06-09_8_20_14_all_35_9]PIY78712.1 MAG: hypothetical protein COY82_01035 [Parcubacteria group bacterium CG_4_10_14_0_8_um_filter_35_7]